MIGCLLRRGEGSQKESRQVLRRDEAVRKEGLLSGLKLSTFGRVFGRS